MLDICFDKSDVWGRVTGYGTVYQIYPASLCVQVNTLALVVIIIREGRLWAVVSNGSGGKAGYIINYLLLARAVSGNIIALGNKIMY